MFKSIFSKQFAVYTGTLIISFTLVGLVLANMFQSYFIKQKTDALVEQGRKIANSYVNLQSAPTFYRTQPAQSGQAGPSAQPWQTPQAGQTTMAIRIPDRATFINDLQTLNTYLGASCFIVNDTFEVTAYTKDIDSLSLSQVIDIAEMSPVMDGNLVVITGNPGGIFSESVLTVGFPIVLNNDKVLGAIFMNTSMAEVQKTTQDVIRITSLCLVASLCVAFVLVYVSSKTISKPIFQINEAAKVIAGGDFEKRLNVKSKDEVGQLAESFNNMAESLANNERNRREFIANISHDLRSPLTSMKGFLQAIIDGTIPEDGQEKYLNIVLDESDRLSKLANDILDISKIENLQTGINRTDFDINELIRKTIIMFETHITNKNLELEISFAEERIIVNADMERIQRVLFNLIDNAIKFTPSLGKITILTYFKDNRKVYISIKDTGCGISPDEQKRIFERFYKVDTSRGEDKKGSGLGLSIVREFIKAHDETIVINSDIDKGCEFVFSLQAV